MTPVDRFEQRKQTRTKLIDAALQLFSTSGYDHATVDDVSNAAGYSKGAYYFHFSTKDDILMELLRMWTEDRTRVLDSGPEPGGPDGGLRQMTASFFSYADTPEWPSMLLEFWAQAVRNPEVSKKLTAAYAGWRRRLADAFSEAAARGELQVASADDAAAVVLSAHDGYAVQVAIGTPGGKHMKPGALADLILAPLEGEQVAQRRAAAR